MTAGFLTNVVLDALFISVFRWGTAGAAAATVIAQGVSAALGLVYLFRVKRVFRGVELPSEPEDRSPACLPPPCPPSA